MEPGVRSDCMFLEGIVQDDKCCIKIFNIKIVILSI